MQKAASLFDLQGYTGTSLAQIVKETGGISAGALNFHFSSKAELARAVVEAGDATTRAALAELDDIGGDTDSDRDRDPLDQVIGLTLALVRLLEADDTVRAAIRLERELPGVEPWSRLWLPHVDALLRRAGESGRLRPSAAPETVSGLVCRLVAGTETLLRHHRHTRPGTPTDSAELLAAIWQLVLTGIAPQAEPRPPQVDA
ncbi:TetR family transcriptional regulator [Streptomyces sp. Da 82-17]|uniref:TetR family transcriptional regulator n=1 Tax=Streptomyces sp. Da 82-17 TaxID=3377116 RepID=UPI0038D4FA30